MASHVPECDDLVDQPTDSSLFCDADLEVRPDDGLRGEMPEGPEGYGG